MALNSIINCVSTLASLLLPVQVQSSLIIKIVLLFNVIIAALQQQCNDSTQRTISELKANGGGALPVRFFNQSRQSDEKLFLRTWSVELVHSSTAAHTARLLLQIQSCVIRAIQKKFHFQLKLVVLAFLCNFLLLLHSAFELGNTKSYLYSFSFHVTLSAAAAASTQQINPF